MSDVRDLVSLAERQLRAVREFDQLIAFGPAGDRLPARFGARIVQRNTLVELELTFDGVSRVRVLRAELSPADGHASLDPTDLAGTQFAALVRGVVTAEIERAPLADGPDPLLRLAQVYWRAHVSWGKPRLDVMAAFDLPRSTANHWIRKARDLYPLPGPHADLGRT